MNQPREHWATPGPLERRTQSIAYGLFILALGVLAGVGAREASSREQPQDDKRTAIALSANQREAVLKDMRTMLMSMQSVMDGATKMDVPRIRAASQAAGTAAMAAYDSATRAQLPEAFRRQSAEVRATFDGLAEAVRGFTARDTTLAYMSRISAQCVACHAQFRLIVKE
jgi:cytochrome c556